MTRRIHSYAAVSLLLASSCFSYGCGFGADQEAGNTESIGADHTSPNDPPSTFNAPLPSSGDDAPSNANGYVQNAPNLGAAAGGPSSVTPPAPPTTPPSTPADPPVTPPVTPPTPPSTPPATNPSPPPTETCSVSKDANGFFWRTSAKSDYVGYVPASYSPTKPMRVIVGMHGCSDDAMNFAKWGISPWDTRATQQHIGISVGGETGSNHCWAKGVDDDKVLAAVDDIAKCFWVDRSKVIIAGFSSGGELAYRVGLMNASKFAGILIENSSLYAAGSPASTLLGGAAWKLPIAHRAHSSDSVFPISQVKADWSTIQSAGFPIATSEVAGTHDGDGQDWASWLIPQSASWVKP